MAVRPVARLVHEEKASASSFAGKDAYYNPAEAPSADSTAALGYVHEVLPNAFFDVEVVAVMWAARRC